MEQQLLTACCCGEKAEVEALIAKGVNVHAKNSTGVTPILYATDRGYTEIVQLLLAANADPNDVSPGGFSALSRASELGNIELVKALLDAGANVNLYDQKSINPICIAISKGHLDIVKLLLSAGANVHAVSHGIPPLGLAEDAAMAATLLDAGADPNQVESGFTVLTYLIAKMKVEAIALCLARGADANMVAPSHGLTPLMAAMTATGAGCGSPTVMDVLLAAGACPSAVDSCGRSVLHIAAGRRGRLVAADVGALNTLLAHCGPELLALRDNQGMTALHTALCLATERESPSTPLRVDTVMSFVKAMGAAGADMEGRVPKDGRTALLMACAGGLPTVVKALLEAGADPHALDAENNTALMLSVTTKPTARPAIVSLICEATGEDAEK